MTPLNFVLDDSAAITVDYTFLTATMVILGLSLLILLSPGVIDMADDTGTSLEGAEIVAVGDLP